MSKPATPYSANPVYDVHDLGFGRHESYICEWDVVDREGIFVDGPFETQGEAIEEAERLNRAATPEAA